MTRFRIYKIVDHRKQKHRRGGGSPTDKHEVPLLVNDDICIGFYQSNLSTEYTSNNTMERGGEKERERMFEKARPGRGRWGGGGRAVNTVLVGGTVIIRREVQLK